MKFRGLFVALAIALFLVTFYILIKPTFTKTTEARHDWQAPPEELGVLVFSAHPDDEGIFFGGVIPYYALVKKMSVAIVVMVSDMKGKPYEIRETELSDAAWHYGIRIKPVFGRFLDHTHMGGLKSMYSAFDAWDGDEFNGVADLNNNKIYDGREKGALFMAEQIRRFRPAIIITHDINGEYGHGAHKATAICAIDAFSIAADSSVDIKGLAPWQAKKLYVHLYEENKVFHTGLEDAYPELEGKTPRQVAKEGLKYHMSQLGITVSSYYESNEKHDGYDSERWGLYASFVGNDPKSDGIIGKNVHYGDFLENLDNL